MSFASNVSDFLCLASEQPNVVIYLEGKRKGLNNVHIRYRNMYIIN